MLPEIPHFVKVLYLLQEVYFIQVLYLLGVLSFPPVLYSLELLFPLEVLSGLFSFMCLTSDCLLT